MDLITSVLILLSVSLIIGELLEVKGLPSVVGALVVGLSGLMSTSLFPLRCHGRDTSKVGMEHHCRHIPLRNSHT